MPLLGFTVFKDKIQSGSKSQTIRKERKYPIIKGANLFLYWHTRRPDCEKLGEAPCTDTFLIRMENTSTRFRVWREGSGFCMNREETDELAKRDGFENWQEMAAWFYNKYGPIYTDQLFQVIRWDKNSIVGKNKSEGEK